MEKVGKQTRLQKLKEKLDDATELEKQKQYEFKQLKRNQKGMDRHVEELYWECKDAKEKLYNAKKEQKKIDTAVKKDKENVRNAQHQALDLKIEYAVMAKTEQEKEEKYAIKNDAQNVVNLNAIENHLDVNIKKHTITLIFIYTSFKIA